MSTGPSLASKGHSQEQSVIFTQDHPQERITVINDSLIITPRFQGGSISTCSPIVRGGFISFTCSSFMRRVHIFDLFLLSEKGPYHHCSSLRGQSFRTTPSLSRKCSNFTQDRALVNTSTTCSSVLAY